MKIEIRREEIIEENLEKLELVVVLSHGGSELELTLNDKGSAGISCRYGGELVMMDDLTAGDLASIAQTIGNMLNEYDEWKNDNGK